MEQLCETVGCSNIAEYIDPFGNLLCESCMEQDAEEMMQEHSEYEKITPETKCINLNT
jgi:hypothetical protein